MHLGAGTQVNYYDGGKHCIIQLGDCSERTLIEVHKLLLHEAVHIWLRVKKVLLDSIKILHVMFCDTNKGYFIKHKQAVHGNPIIENGTLIYEIRVGKVEVV